jgi:hypothetical protein
MSQGLSEDEFSKRLTIYGQNDIIIPIPSVMQMLLTEARVHSDQRDPCDRLLTLGRRCCIRSTCSS